jgi:hypothetical protein
MTPLPHPASSTDAETTEMRASLEEKADRDKWKFSMFPPESNSSLLEDWN